MITIEFVHYSETKLGTSYYTVPAIISIKLDPQSISGIDYYSVESRKAKISFRKTGSFIDSYFIDNFVLITDIKYNIFAIRIKNNDVIDYIGYIKPSDFKYDEKTKICEISATNIVGVLNKLSNKDKDYDNGTYNVNTLLETEITEILDIFDIDYSDTSDNVSFNVTDSEMVFDNQGEFEEVEGYTVMGNVQDGWKARIRDVRYISGYFRVILCDWNQEYNSISGIYMEQIKYVFLTFKENLIYVSNHYDSRMIATGTPFTLWNDWAVGGYGTTENNQSASNGGSGGGGDVVSFGTGINGTRFYYTGTINIESIEIDPEDEEATYITQNRKSMITMLLILLNAGMRIEKDGDIVIEDKDLIDEANAIEINSYIIENKKGYILHSNKDFDSMFSFIKNLKNIGIAVKTFYDALFETFNRENHLEIRPDIALILGNTIKLNNLYKRIISIDEPYNQHKYIVKAWGE